MQKKKLLLTVLLLSILGGVGALLYLRKAVVDKDWEPHARQALINYLEERFDASVKIGALDFRLLEGTRIEASGRDFELHYQRRTDIPPLLAFATLKLETDLATLYDGPRVIDRVTLTGLRIVMPPKGQRPAATASSQPKGNNPNPVHIKEIIADGAKFLILPSKPNKAPLDFDLTRLTLRSPGPGQPFHYATTLKIPKPPGLVQAKGRFGPWKSSEPRETPLSGDYTLDHADLGVFQGIAGTLASTGSFDGVLEAIQARGKCEVPNFRLDMAGNPVPLNVQYQATVDGSDGDTYLRKVDARLGQTAFTATGAITGQQGQPGRAIQVNVDMPNGYLSDLLRLVLKGDSKFLAGRIQLRTSIDIPRGPGQVIDKIRLKGQFAVREANFASQTIQDKIDSLSQRGRGRPRDPAISGVPATFNGKFQMANARLTFTPVTFAVPGALVDLTGSYRLNEAWLDLHGSLSLDAKMSDTFDGWKRWALKPFNPIFSKEEAGTFLPIQIVGDRNSPQFGLDKRRKR
jgi:hypothetical protein